MNNGFPSAREIVVSSEFPALAASARAAGCSRPSSSMKKRSPVGRRPAASANSGRAVTIARNGSPESESRSSKRMTSGAAQCTSSAHSTKGSCAARPLMNRRHAFWISSSRSSLPSAASAGLAVMPAECANASFTRTRSAGSEIAAATISASAAGSRAPRRISRSGSSAPISPLGRHRAARRRTPGCEAMNSSTRRVLP